MTTESASVTREMLKSGGRLLLCRWSHLDMDVTPWEVSMFVYIETASAERRDASGGSGPRWFKLCSKELLSFR